MELHVVVKKGWHVVCCPYSVLCTSVLHTGGLGMCSLPITHEWGDHEWGGPALRGRIPPASSTGEEAEFVLGKEEGRRQKRGRVHFYLRAVICIIKWFGARPVRSVDK